MAFSENTTNATGAFNTSKSFVDFVFSAQQRNLLIGISCADVVENIIGFAGNLIIIIAIVKSKLLKSYAHLLILNLAVADCFTSLFTPLDIANVLWIVADPTDERQKTFCFVCSIYLSICTMQNILSMTLIAIDRWISIEFPFYYTTRINERAVRYQICGSWVLGIIITTASVYVKQECWLEEEGVHAVSVAAMVLCLMITIICYGRLAVVAAKLKGRDRLKRKLQMAKTLCMYLCGGDGVHVHV